MPDAFEQEQRRHEAYAIPRRRLYLGGERYIAALDTAIAGGAQRILVEGQSGGGKSALMANWLAGHASNNPANQIHSYYLGATANATAPDALVRHLVERIKRTTGSEDEISSDPQALYDSLPTWLANASAHAAMHDYRWVVVLDALNNLSDMRDLRWLPSFLPERVHIAVSCLPGDVRDALSGKGDWQAILVEPLAADERQTLLRKFLSHYNKTLAPDLEARALVHPLAANPLFLRTLAEELRLFGSHEELSDRLDLYLTSKTVDDLFERVLARVEQDCGAERVQTAMEAIWASRAGLTEEEIIEFSKLVPATWAPIRLALDGSLMESGGRITFAHDYMRIGVSDRYMVGNNELGDENQSEEALTLRRKAHETLAKWFAKRPADARTAEELPWQWQQARNWKMLKACLTKREMFEAIYAERSNEELLGYWLDLEANTKADLALAYEAAWKRWKPDEAIEKTGKLAASLSYFLHEAGRYRHPLTLQLARLALAMAEKELNPDYHYTIRCINKVAVILKDFGYYLEAENTYLRSLNISESIFGKDHQNTAKTVNDIGLLYYQMDKLDESKTFLQRALSIRENVLGPCNNETGITLNDLSLPLHKEGDYDTAEKLLLRSLAIFAKTLGSDHPEVADSLSNLATVIWDKNDADIDQSEKLYCRALAITEKMLGPEHPKMISSLCHLASHLSDSARAEPLYRRALAIAEKAKGPQHPDTRAALYALESER